MFASGRPGGDVERLRNLQKAEEDHQKARRFTAQQQMKVTLAKQQVRRLDTEWARARDGLKSATQVLQQAKGALAKNPGNWAAQETARQAQKKLEEAGRKLRDVEFAFRKAEQHQKAAEEELRRLDRDVAVAIQNVAKYQRR